MMKEKKILISVLMIMIAITINGCIYDKHHKSVTPVADLIQSHLDRVGEAELSTEIKLSDFTSFEWDEVLIFNYPTTEQEIEDALGVSYNGETDLVSGMIFVKNGEIIHMEYFDYDYNFDRPGKFLICPQTEIGASPHYRVFSAKDAVFSGEKAESDGYVYYRLYPTSSEDSSLKAANRNCWVNYTKDEVVTYDADLLFNEIEHTKAQVEIEIVDETLDYQIIHMSISNWEELNIPEYRKEIGVFYCADNDVIYKIDEQTDITNFEQGTIVASPEPMGNDTTGSSERMEKSTITLKDNICVYKYTNGLVETGYYECFIWEKDVGLIEYRSGFGAQSQEIYLHETDTTQLSSWEGCYEYYEFIEPNINMQYHVDIYQNDSSYYADVEILGFQTDKKLLCTVVGDENRINIIYAETAKPEMYNAFKPGDILLAFQHNDTGLETEWIGLTPLQLNVNANDYFKQVSDKAGDGCSNSGPITISEQTYTFTDNNCNIQISYPKIDQDEYETLNDKLYTMAASEWMEADGVTKENLNVVIAYEITSLDENILSVKFTGYRMIQDGAYPVELCFASTFDLHNQKLLELFDFIPRETALQFAQDDNLVVEYGGLKAFSSEERSLFLESILSGKDSYAMRQVYIENEKLYFIVGSLSHALGDYSIIRLNYSASLP